ncbi:Myblike DNAbinding domain-containing protein [Borealophlyctis nickersoniae]|nr:Myblike DNAbinding domain-containing protein [Borealophlyctis nickersoniae]
MQESFVTGWYPVNWSLVVVLVIARTLPKKNVMVKRKRRRTGRDALPEVAQLDPVSATQAGEANSNAQPRFPQRNPKMFTPTSVLVPRMFAADSTLLLRAFGRPARGTWLCRSFVTAKGGAVATPHGADFPPPLPPKEQRRWTQEEDQVLLNEIEMAKEEGRKPRFTEVGRLIGRLGPRVYQRWCQVLDPELRKGSWTSEEDAFLVKAVKEAELLGREPAWTPIGQSLHRGSIPVRRRWENNLSPTIKRGRFTELENSFVADAVYRARVENRKPQWPTIAKALSRSPGPVYLRWMAAHDPCLRKRNWSHDEDQVILQEVENSRLRGCKPDWACVGRLLGRSNICVRARYFHISDLTIKHGKWSKEQDEQLCAFMREHGGNNFPRVSKLLQRSSSDVRNRWVNVTNPALKKGRWRLEEKELLHEEIRRAHAAGFKPNWAKIGRLLGRSPGGVRSAACRRHWYKHQETGKLQRLAIFTSDGDGIAQNPK